MRKGDYCILHIENMRDNECITEKRYRELKDWGVFREGYSEVSELSEAACTPLMREKDTEVKAKAIEAVAKNISNGNVPTAKQVKSIIENKRAGVKPGGRIHSGKDSVPEQPILTMEDFLSQEKNDVGDVEDPEMDMVQDYYSGDAPTTPDEQENLDGGDVQKPPGAFGNPEEQKTDIAVPPDISDISEEMKKERVAQAIKDLQKEKEDERERNEITEKNENTKNRDALVSVLKDAMRTALHEGITRKEVFEALHIAIDRVFEPIESDTERKSNGSEQTSGGLFKRDHNGV